MIVAPPPNICAHVHDTHTAWEKGGGAALIRGGGKEAVVEGGLDDADQERHVGVEVHILGGRKRPCVCVVCVAGECACVRCVG